VKDDEIQLQRTALVKRRKATLEGARAAHREAGSLLAAAEHADVKLLKLVLEKAVKSVHLLDELVEEDPTVTVTEEE